MERRTMMSRGRPALLPALVYLLVAVVPETLVRAAGGNSRVASAPGRSWDQWPTQDWPTGAQDGDQSRGISVNFTGAQYQPSAGLPADPGPSLVWLGEMGYSDTIGSGPVFGGDAQEIVGEVATAHCAGMDPVGPQGVAVALSADGILTFASPAAWQGYGASRFVHRPGGNKDFVGTPVVLGSAETQTSGRDTTGFFTVFAAANNYSTYGGPSPRLVIQEFQTFYSAGTKSKSLEVRTGGSDAFYLGYNQYLTHGPTLSEGVMFLATRGYGTDSYNEGMILAFSLDGKSSWSQDFQIGPGSRGSVPKGQEPPDASEWYGAVTPVAATAQLAVVGCQGISEDSWEGAKHALFGYNALDGSLRWVVKVGSRIMPGPAIVGDSVIFGTADGRAYCVDAASGVFRWQTAYAARMRYRTKPYNEPEEWADTVLYGPAIDAAGQTAWFGGSDGGIAIFNVASGVAFNTGSVLYHASRRPGYTERDKNGKMLLRPLTMSCPPAIYGNNGVVFKLNTLNYDVDRNGSFLLTLAGEGAQISPVPFVSFFPQAALFMSGGTPVSFAAINGNSYGNLFNYDLIRQVPYVDDPGYGYMLYSGQTDTGGISMGSGYLFATDRGGHVAMIPAYRKYTMAAPSGASGPYPPPRVGPPEDLPPGLGPIEVYPNPFDPAKAVGHVAKFRNLPAGAYVELYTLAYERVRTLNPVNHRAEWDGTNEAGQSVATGVYLYRIVLPGNVPAVTGRLALIRK